MEAALSSSSSDISLSINPGNGCFVCFSVIDCCGIVVRLLQDFCENAVGLLWDFCGIAVGLLRHCCGINVGFQWHGCGYCCDMAVSFCFAVGLL